MIALYAVYSIYAGSAMYAAYLLYAINVVFRVLVILSQIISENRINNGRGTHDDVPIYKYCRYGCFSALYSNTFLY